MLKTGFALGMGGPGLWSPLPFAPVGDAALETLSCPSGSVARHSLGYQGTSLESFRREDKDYKK